VLYLTVAGGASATELDLRLFEEELLTESEPVPAPHPAAVVNNGSGADAELVEQ
jgi:hypothetical protein